MSVNILNLKDYVRDIPDFPKPGILFRDISPLLADPAALAQAVTEMAAPFKHSKVDYVAAVEARGFIFGSAVAKELSAGFIPIRKESKLPCRTISYTYELEYGSDTLEVHADAIRPGSSVLMIDDLLATGGTMAAACSLIESLKGSIAGLTFLIELEFLKGRQRFADYHVSTILQY